MHGFVRSIRFPHGGTDTSSTSPARNRLSVATFVVAVLILVAVLGMLGLDIWRTTQPSAAGLAGMVQTSMDDSLSTEDSFRQYGARVESISVMRVGQNSFEGQAEVRTNTGKSGSVSVHVKYDGDTMFWETNPGAFLFITSP